MSVKHWIEIRDVGDERYPDRLSVYLHRDGVDGCFALMYGIDLESNRVNELRQLLVKLGLPVEYTSPQQETVAGLEGIV